MSTLFALDIPPRTWYKRSRSERIACYKKGVPVQIIRETAALLKMSCRQLILMLGLPPSVMVQRTSKEKLLSPTQAELVIGVLCLAGQIETMLDESNSSDFDAVSWFARWLQSSVPALGGRMPAEYLDTYEGQLLISQLLGAAESGAYW